MNPGANPQPDDDTVRRFIAGDLDAFNAIYDWLSSQLLSFLKTQLRNQQNAEDVSQITWAIAWNKRQTFDGGDIRAWVFKISRNRMIDKTRVQKRHEQVQELTEQIEPTKFSDPSLSVVRKEELTAFEDCANSIGGIFVAALLRTKFMGHSPEDMAAESGVSRATIDTRVNRGKKQIEECLEEKGWRES